MGELIRVEGLEGRRDFERRLAERFPQIAAEIDDSERGLLHMEMAVLARATRRAVDAADWDQVQAHLGFVGELLSAASPELENAVYVSYLEDVFLSSEGPQYLLARSMLSERLQSALAELETHWRSVAEWKAHEDR